MAWSTRFPLPSATYPLLPSSRFPLPCPASTPLPSAPLPSQEHSEYVRIAQTAAAAAAVATGVVSERVNPVGQGGAPPKGRGDVELLQWLLLRLGTSQCRLRIFLKNVAFGSWKRLSLAPRILYILKFYSARLFRCRVYCNAVRTCAPSFPPLM
jgi:hypothetical protein